MCCICKWQVTSHFLSMNKSHWTGFTRHKESGPVNHHCNMWILISVLGLLHDGFVDFDIYLCKSIALVMMGWGSGVMDSKFVHLFNKVFRSMHQPLSLMIEVSNLYSAKIDLSISVQFLLLWKVACGLCGTWVCSPQLLDSCYCQQWIYLWLAWSMMLQEPHVQVPHQDVAFCYWHWILGRSHNCWPSPQYLCKCQANKQFLLLIVVIFVFLSALCGYLL